MSSTNVNNVTSREGAHVPAVKSSTGEIAPKVIPVWKSFIFEHGSYLLHLPTSSIISAGDELAAEVSQGKTDQPELLELLAQFPAAPEKELDEINIMAIALNVEESCNLRCTYCYAGDGNYGKDSSMTFEKAKDIISHLAEEKPRFHIQFFGGEPLLNFKLIQDVVHWCHEQKTTRFTFSVTTNGVLLRDSIMEFFKKHKFSMTLSYDGKGVQEKQRKTKSAQSSGKLIRSKIEKYEKEFKELASFTIRATISSKHVAELETAMKDSIDSFSLSFAASRAAVDKFGNSYSDEDIEKLIEANTNVINYFLEIEDYESLFKLSKNKFYIDMLHNGRVNQNACTAGLSYMSVSTSGSFYLCHRFTEDEEAKVGDYKTGIDREKLNEIRQHRLGKKEPCNSCWMKNWCGGGCYHENKAATGKIDGIDRDFCKIQDSEISLAMKCYTQIQLRKPELLES